MPRDCSLSGCEPDSYDALAVERIAIFAALQWECGAVVRHLRQVERSRLGAFTLWRSRAARQEVWVVKTGVGVQRAAAAVDALGDAARFALLMSTGCAGGLAPELRPGDLALATSVVCDGASDALPTDAAARRSALRAMDAAGLRGLEGVVLCSTTALATAAAKRAAAARGAIAVEMEAAPIAARALAAQIPFLSVRAILDGVEHELSGPGTLVDAATGAVRPLAVAGYLAAHPGAIFELLALQRMQRAARGSLERFFARWFEP